MIKQSNNNANPETNSALKKLVDEALAQSVPKASVDKMLKRSQINEELAQEWIWEIRGPGRVGVIVECLAKSKGRPHVNVSRETITLLRKFYLPHNLK